MYDRKAACFGMTDIMFPDSGDVQAEQRAINICGKCHMIYRCERDNMHEEYGVWFGTTELQRRRLRRITKIK